MLPRSPVNSVTLSVAGTFIALTSLPTLAWDTPHSGVRTPTTPLHADAHLASLVSDLNGTRCAVTYSMEYPKIKIYTSLENENAQNDCEEELRSLIPGLSFTATAHELPAHSGSIDWLELEVSSYEPQQVDVPHRIAQMSKVPCVTLAISPQASEWQTFVSEYARNQIAKSQPDASRTLYLSLNNVTNWGEFEACLNTVRDHLGPGVIGRSIGGTPFHIDGKGPYAVVRLYR